MILSHTTTDARAESWTLSCDVCGDILDPGALDAPMGGWSTQRAAVDAGETHGWAVDVYEVGRDLCPVHANGAAA